MPDASDPEGDALTFDAEGVPAWADFDSTTGTLSGIPSAADIGVYESIAIGVSDGEFTTWTDFFEINVAAETSTLLTLSWVPPSDNTDGNPLIDLSGFRIYYWDEDVYPDVDSALVIDLSDPGLSGYVLELPWTGLWKVAITAYNVEGRESKLAIVPVMAN
jgi:hypothetical protein